MHSLLLLLVIGLGFASERSIMDKTYPRDGSICYLGKKRIAIMIRGIDKVADPTEKDQGEYVLYDVLGKIRKFPGIKPDTESYRFFKEPRMSKICSGSQAYLLENRNLAVLFLQDEGQGRGKLLIELIDVNTLVAQEFVDTDFVSSKTIPWKNGFAFNTLPERDDTDLGSVKIVDISYTYQDRDFSSWMGYSLGSKFEVLPDVSYQQSAFKHFFKDEKDFLETFLWDGTAKKFKRNQVYFAINHALKKECLLVTDGPVKLKGSEAWRCQDFK